MAISFRTSTQNSSSTGTAISVAAPTGTTTGDLVKVIVHGNGQTTIVDNNGATPFTEQINDYQPNTTSGHTISIFSRVIQAGDPSTYNFTLGASGRWAAIAICATDSTTPADDYAPNTGTGATNRDSSGDGDAVTEAITTGVNNAINIVVAGWDTAAIGTITTPSGYTLLANANGGGEPLHASYKVITTAGTTGTQTISNTEFAAYITFSFSIKSSAGGSSYTPTYTETMIFVDTVNKSTSRTITDVATYVDTVIKNPARILTDVTTLVDTIVRAPGKLQSEVINLVDTYSRVWITSRTFEEATTLVDTVPKSTSRTLSDQASLIDTIVFSTGKVFTEAMALVDTITKSISRTLTDASALVDTLEKNAGHLLTETIALVDSFTRSVGRFLLEVVTMVDSVIKSISRTLYEVLSLVDVLVRGILRYLSDFFTMVDTFISELISNSYSAILTETMTLVDNIEKLFNHIISGIPTTLRHLAQIRPFGFLRNRRPEGSLDDVKPDASSGRGIENGISLKDKNKPSMM